MIPYVEIISKSTLKRTEIIEPNECWFELSYYDVGEFEVYCNATPNNLLNLVKGNYVKIPNKNYIWVITSVQYQTTEKRNRVIIAKGYEAKWLLSKRIIQTPVELPTSLAQAVYNLVNNNIGANAGGRKIDGFTVELSEQTTTIEQTLAPRGNLLTFVDELLKINGYGSQVIYENEGLKYKLLFGENLQITFSQSMDNLLNSSYLSDDKDLGTCITIVSEQEVNEVKTEYIRQVDNGGTGVDRNEVYLSNNLSTKYEDDQGVEHELNLTNQTDLATYYSWLDQIGKNELTNHETIEELNGTIDLNNSNYEFEVDYKLGDKVKIHDDYFNFELTKRIIKYTISQSTQYNEAADYGE